MSQYALRLEHISKSFGSIRANRDVTLSVRPGTIHGIVGENGAGKTTLMRIAYGFYQPDQGRVLVDDAPVALTSPRVALGLGIGMVHQHSLLVDSMTATENLLLAVPRPVLAIRLTAQRLRALADETGLMLDPDERVRDLSVANRQRLEILKALYHGARIVILDEPTAVLTPQEARALFEHLRKFAADGRTIVIITHKLLEVMDVTSQVSVLRAGELVYEAETAQTDEATLARAMVGRTVSLRLERAAPAPASDTPAAETVLQIEGLSAEDDHGIPRVRSVDLSVRAGEIVAIAAVEGNGQRELAEAVSGLRRPSAGRVVLLGHDVTRATPRRRRELGMRSIAEDRLERGVNVTATITENVIAGRHYRPPFARRWLLDLSAARRYASDLIERFAIVASGPDARVGTLSGGNIQKVVVARELADGARLVVAAQPTQGVDVGATEFIRRHLATMRAKGTAILLISSELSEIVDLADRVYVLFGGEVVAEVTGSEIDEERLGLLMMGGRRVAGPLHPPAMQSVTHG
jgi:ABC-type uncharacterized transport system ATPase subunit